MKFLSSICLLAATVLALPRNIPHFTVPQEHLEVLRMRADTTVNPDAVFDVECIDPNLNIVFHDTNVAQLAICGGIAGAITKCEGSPTSTTGESGTARFDLDPTVDSATINISKGRWEQCVRAARAVCPTGSMSGTCVGGASSGDIAFTLTKP